MLVVAKEVQRFDGVAIIHFIILVSVIGFYEHTRLSSALAGPDISLAFLAYICIASSEKSVLIRAWALGLAMDLWNPLTSAWYMTWYLLLAVFFLPLRSLVFQKSLSGWFLWAVALHFIMASLLGGHYDLWYADATRVCFDACMTGFAAVIIGAAVNECAPSFHPLGGADVP